MELQPAEQAIAGRKRSIRIFFGLFIGLLIACTLLGNTLAALTLPKVAFVMTRQGEITHSFIGGGLLKWKAEAALSNDSGWKVDKVHVKTGDVVNKGQKLVTYDAKAAEQPLLDEQASLQKLKLELEGQQQTFVQAAQSGDEQRIEDAKRALKLSEIDIDVQERKIRKLQQDLAAGRELIAPFDGIVMQVGATEGLVSSTGGPDVLLSNRSQGLQFDVAVPADAVALLEPGAQLSVQVLGKHAKEVEGTVEDIQDESLTDQQTGGSESLSPNLRKKRLRVALQDDELQAGERVQVELTKTTDEVILLPNKAIREEGDRKFVFTIEERNGPLGNAFYVRKVTVTVADSTDTQAAISGGLFDQERVIIESSEPLQEGDKIRMQ